MTNRQLIVSWCSVQFFKIESYGRKTHVHISIWVCPPNLAHSHNFVKIAKYQYFSINQTLFHWLLLYNFPIYRTKALKLWIPKKTSKLQKMGYISVLVFTQSRKTLRLLLSSFSICPLEIFRFSANMDFVNINNISVRYLI